ncbi:hypothetical protein FV219_01590 [Methylobacterium sp. WL122]|nr:hypothetical protein FV219_01590 [Methylobacterium sp. WL122]
MQEVAGLTNEVAQRLLTDARMEQAWKDLKELPEPADLQERLSRIPGGLSPDAYGIDVGSLTAFDRQSAALFYQVMIEVYQPQRTYWTRGEAVRLAQPFLDAANLCKEAPRTDPAIGMRQDLLDALKLVGSYLEDQGQMRQMLENPRVIERRIPEVADEKRGHARIIATIIRDIFSPPVGDFPHSAVGRFMAVSLDTDDDVMVLKNSVRSWCKDLPPEKRASL